MLYIIAYIFFKWLLWLIYRPKVFGNKKNLRIKGGVIFIANHRALYDPLLLVVSSPRIIHFMSAVFRFTGKTKSDLKKTLPTGLSKSSFFAMK